MMTTDSVDWRLTRVRGSCYDPRIMLIPTSRGLTDKLSPADKATMRAMLSASALSCPVPRIHQGDPRRGCALYVASAPLDDQNYISEGVACIA
jgi:hypothetical protein